MNRSEPIATNDASRKVIEKVLRKLKDSSEESADIETHKILLGWKLLCKRRKLSRIEEAD